MLSPDAPVWMVAAVVGVLFLAMMAAVYLVLSR
jgi:DMSO reductase anchor subunit